MEKSKLTRKERTLNPDMENRKNFIAYDGIKLYAETDIPIPGKSRSLEGGMLTPQSIWHGYDPKEERFEEETVFSEGNIKKYTFCAMHREDGNLTVELDVYTPEYDSPKGVLIIGEYGRLPQKSVIESIVKRGIYVFTADYNGLKPDTLTVFPPSLSYGKHGNEGEHLTRLFPTAVETCPYLYTLIHRRVLALLSEKFGQKEIIVLGIRSGVEIAMQVAGTEKKSVTALACICGAGYPEYSDIPRYGSGKLSLDDVTLSFIVGASGVSYMKNYPNPVFVAVGSNDTYSDVDRISSLEKLIMGTLTTSIAQKFTDNIDTRTWNNCLRWLNSAFWGSDFPPAPVSTVEVNRDGTVYANITAAFIPKIKGLTLYYSYNNIDHKSRIWRKIACETAGEGQYIAKLEFDEQCTSLFYYTEAVYVNGMIVTESPKYTDLSESRVLISPQKSSAVLFRHGAEGEFLPVSEDAVIPEGKVCEGTVPSGAKGTVCHDGSMKLFVGDACKTITPDKLLQADTYSNEPYALLEIKVTAGYPATEYRASKRVQPGSTFTGTQFACNDFKDDFFRPLTKWAEVNLITVITPDVIINKLTFI